MLCSAQKIIQKLWSERLKGRSPNWESLTSKWAVWWKHMSRPQGIIGMPSSRINCWIARPLAQPICPWGVLWTYCNSTEWGSPLFQVEDKGPFYLIYGCVCARERRAGNILFSPWWEAEEGHLHAKHRICSCELQSGTWQDGPGRVLAGLGAEGGKYAVFPTAMAKGSGEWAKFRMNEHSSAICGTFPWLRNLPVWLRGDWDTFRESERQTEG